METPTGLKRVVERMRDQVLLALQPVLEVVDGLQEVAKGAGGLRCVQLLDELLQEEGEECWRERGGQQLVQHEERERAAQTLAGTQQKGVGVARVCELR